MGDRFQVQTDEPGQRLELAFLGRAIAPLKSRQGCLSVILLVLVVLVPVGWYITDKDSTLFLAFKQERRRLDTL